MSPDHCTVQPSLALAIASAIACGALLAACADATPAGSPMAAARSAPPASAKATAELKPTQGNTAAGSVTLTQEGDRVVFAVDVRGLKPNQEHGFHVHEKGDCSSPDAMSAGGHFNPTHKAHGPQDQDHHMGDLPALKADAAGNAKMSFAVPGTLAGPPETAFVGKAVVVHANRDDYVTQPTGNSGARIACGVVAMPG